MIFSNLFFIWDPTSQKLCGKNNSTIMTDSQLKAKEKPKILDTGSKEENKFVIKIYKKKFFYQL